MRRFLFAVCCLLIWPVSGHAASDVVATYVHQDGTMMTLYVRDAEHVRMDTSKDSYTLLKGDKVYAVSRDDEGRWQVMDMEKMAAMASGMGSMFGGGGPDPAGYEFSYAKTGRKETVAGYTGLVYNAEVKEKGKLVSRDEVVLSTHGDLVKVNDGWTALAVKMTKAMGRSGDASLQKSLQEAREYGYGGVLRYGDEMQLKSLKLKDLPSSYFALPEGAQEMGQDMNQAEAAPEQGDGVLDKDAKDVGQAAHDEAKDATIDEVREGVRSMFKSIF